MALFTTQNPKGISRSEAGQGWETSGRIWMSLVRLPDVGGRDMTIKSSQDLWIEPTAPLGDVVEQSGQFGGVCGPIGGVYDMAFTAFFQIHFLVH